MMKTRIDDMFCVTVVSPLIGEDGKTGQRFYREDDAWVEARRMSNIATECRVIVSRVQRWELSGVDEMHFCIGEVYKDPPRS